MQEFITSIKPLEDIAYYLLVKKDTIVHLSVVELFNTM